jgi:hypothetical protein
LYFINKCPSAKHFAFLTSSLNWPSFWLVVCIITVQQTINAMKTLGLKIVSLFFLMVGGIAVMGQPDRVEVPGDYFSLEGALQLFKQSASPEEFERLLNSPNSKVNNLDLNGDGEIDYIRVINRNEGYVHAFILQAVLSPTEYQDVAVISLEKLANGKAVLQITGDADVYGIETIIEPTEEVRVMAGTSTSRVVVNVWTWPVVRYVYSPYYSVWVSPWHWHMRPVWWYSWRPIAYYEYYSYWQPYRPYYSRCYTHRIVYAQHIYRPYRTSSPVYYKRHHTQIAHYRSTYRDDYHNRRDHSNNRHSVRGYDADHNRRTHYTDERTGRNRYDAGKNGRDSNTSTNRTPAVRHQTSSRESVNERSTINVQPRTNDQRTERPAVNPRMQQERKPNPNVERNSMVKRSEPAYTNRPEVHNKPVVSQPSTPPRNERSTVNQGRVPQQREVRPAERPSHNGKSSAGGGERGSNNGRGKKSN